MSNRTKGIRKKKIQFDRLNLEKRKIFTSVERLKLVTYICYKLVYFIVRPPQKGIRFTFLCDGKKFLQLRGCRNCGHSSGFLPNAEISMP